MEHQKGRIDWKIVFQHKSRPLSDEYQEVALQAVKKWPFLGRHVPLKYPNHTIMITLIGYNYIATVTQHIHFVVHVYRHIF